MVEDLSASVISHTPLASDLIAGQNSQAVQDREVVFLGFLGRHVTPKAAVVLANKRCGVDAVINKVRIDACCGNQLPKRKQGAFRLSDVGRLTVLVAWSGLGLCLIGNTPWWVKPRCEKGAVQKRKKPRLWESWLSLVSAMAGAFWWRGTVRNAPYFQFNGTTSSCRALNNFGKSSRPPVSRGLHLAWQVQLTGF